MTTLINLPLELWQKIFCSFQSDAESDKSCVILALTCKTCRSAFALTKQESCKKAALKRLLQWRAVSTGDYTADGNTASITVRAKLGCRKTVRLIEWLETGYMKVSDFLQAQSSCALGAKTTLALLLAEKRRNSPQKQLDRTAVKKWMVEIANFARDISQYQSVELFHSVSGEQEVQHVFASRTLGVRFHYFPSESDSDSPSISDA